MLDLWLLCRRYAGPLTGTPLPTGGAPGDQPAVLMDAFAMLDRAADKGEA